MNGWLQCSKSRSLSVSRSIASFSSSSAAPRPHMRISRAVAESSAHGAARSASMRHVERSADAAVGLCAVEQRQPAGAAATRGRASFTFRPPAAAALSHGGRRQARRRVGPSFRERAAQDRHAPAAPEPRPPVLARCPVTCRDAARSIGAMEQPPWEPPSAATIKAVEAEWRVTGVCWRLPAGWGTPPRLCA